MFREGEGWGDEDGRRGGEDEEWTIHGRKVQEWCRSGARGNE